MAFTGVRFVAAMAAGVFLTGATGEIGAQSEPAVSSAPSFAASNTSPMPRTPSPIWRAGLWNKPNQACIDKCEVFVNKGCFTELSKKNPTADPASIQDQCEDKFSICLYDCMCDTCDENQIIIKEP